MSCGCFRAGTRVLTLTLGRMLTSTSIRSPTVLVFCSKLQLSFPSLSSVSHHVSVFKRPWVISPRFLISTPARKSCQLPARWRRRYEHLFPYITRAEKQINIHLFLLSKSSRSWSEWRNGLRWWRTGINTGTVRRCVCVASLPPFSAPQCVESFLFYLDFFPILLLPTTFPSNK